jgi:nucleoside 2-deoxyribosyltransferase
VTFALPKIYLAGPGVFRPNAKELGVSLKELCKRYRCEGLWPADNDPPASAALLHLKAEYIYKQNRLMISECAAVLADISPFRGPHMDCGTAWEIGAAVALGTPVFAYTSDMGDLACRFPDVIRRDFCDERGDLIEHFGFPENLMICCSVETICMSAEQALQQCVKHLRSEA